METILNSGYGLWYPKEVLDYVILLTLDIIMIVYSISIIMKYRK